MNLFRYVSVITKWCYICRTKEKKTQHKNIRT